MADIDFAALDGIAAQDGAAASEAAEKNRPLDKLQRERQQLGMLFRQQHEAIMRSGELRARIMQGARDGMDAEGLLALSLECIGAMAGDQSFAGMVYNARHTEDA